MESYFPVPKPIISNDNTFIREIRVSGGLGGAKDIPDGHFYIVEYKDKKAEYTDIGDKLDCIILRQAMKLRKWDTEINSMSYDSSEFLTYNDIVILYDKQSIPTKIIASLPYSHRNNNLPSVKQFKDSLGLRIRYVYYILYNNEIFRMYGGSTDYTGATDKDKPLGFNEYSEDSFMGFLKDTEGEIFRYNCIITLKKHSRKIMLKKFKKGKENTEDINDKLNELYENLQQQHEYILNSADVGDLDEWSNKILDIIKADSFLPILKGTSTEKFIGTTEGLPDKVNLPLLDAEIKEEFDDDLFPPTEEDIKKHEQKKSDKLFQSEQ